MPFTKIYSFFSEDKLTEYKDLSKLLRETYAEIVKITKFKNNTNKTTNNNYKNKDEKQYCVSIILNEDISKEVFNNIVEDTNTLLGIPNLYQYYYYKNGREPENVKYTFTNKPDKVPVENNNKPEKMEFIQDEDE
jgi:hypothetical protein